MRQCDHWGEYMNTPLIIMALVLLVAWLFIRRRQSKKPVAAKPRRRVSGSKKSYHAVSIKFESRACMAAKTMEGQRYLSSEAPRLPLPDCDVTECLCHFAHHKDRRVSKDRRNVFNASGHSGATGRHEQERRGLRDRRNDDDDDYIY